MQNLLREWTMYKVWSNNVLTLNVGEDEECVGEHAGKDVGADNQPGELRDFCKVKSTCLSLNQPSNLSIGREYNADCFAIHADQMQ